LHTCISCACCLMVSQTLVLNLPVVLFAILVVVLGYARHCGWLIDCDSR
jgi:hypothetical protein